MKDDRFDLSGFGADEDFDSFLDSIRRDLGEPERPKRAPAAGTAVIDAVTTPVEPKSEPEPEKGAAPEPARMQEPEPVPAKRQRERIKPEEPEEKPRRRKEAEPQRRKPAKPEQVFHRRRR